jgi:hypothetical protein
MTKTILLATTALLLSGGAASAQTPSAQSAAPQAEANQQGILLFTPDFFADQRPNTALDMVQRVPGFSIVDGDGSRGFEGSVGNLLVNGARPASKNDTGSAVLGRTLAAQVTRIELIRGGAPGIDMQGFSVVVNVITRNESSRQSILTLNTTQFDGGQDLYAGTFQYTAKEGERTWGVTLSDGMGMSDSNGVGTVVRRDGNGAVIREEDYFNDQYGGGTSIRGNFATPLMGGKIDLTARYGVNDWHSYSLQSNAGGQRENQFDNDGSGGEFGVVYSRPLSTRLNLETRFIHQFDSFEGISTQRSRLGAVDNPVQRFVGAGDASETILRGTLRFERSPGLTFESGGEIAYNMLDTQQAFTVGGVPVVLPSASVLVEELRGEVFGKGTWRMRPNLTLEAGLRLEASTITQSGDVDHEKSFFFPKPRFQASWTPRPNNQFVFRFERELGQLDFGDFAASAELSDDNVLGGNVDLEPEQRWITELTYERRFWGDGVISVGLRHDEIVDAIDRIPLDMGLSAVGNIGEGTLDQLSLNILVPMDRFGFTGGRLGFRNTWNHTEVTDPTTGETRAISQVRPSQPVFTIAQDINSWKLQWGGAYILSLAQTGYDPDQTSGFRGADYFELWAEYKPTPTLSLRAQINLWDDFEVQRTVYANRTPARPIAYVENRYVDPRTFVSFRVRKTF